MTGPFQKNREHWFCNDGIDF